MEIPFRCKKNTINTHNQYRFPSCSLWSGSVVRVNVLEKGMKDERSAIWNKSDVSHKKRQVESESTEKVKPRKDGKTKIIPENTQGDETRRRDHVRWTMCEGKRRTDRQWKRDRDRGRETERERERASKWDRYVFCGLQMARRRQSGGLGAISHGCGGFILEVLDPS